MALRPKFLLRLEFPNWNEVYKQIKASRTVAENEARNAMRDIGRILVRHLKAKCPIGFHYDHAGIPRMSGNLRASIAFRTYERERFGAGRDFSMGFEYPSAAEGGTLVQITMADYGRYTLPPGTRPHVIFPRNSRFLVFYWTKLQKLMFLKKVNHPGYEGDPWDMRAFESARPEIEERWAAAAETWRVFTRRVGTEYNR